ncbi:Uncharacterized protein TCM_014369 [Theobroma cacao]|uniref:Uncharacterized protein n=1 Tax=Theobroma cacao TaxID=3641 RepID=A0A061FYQ8_THECC|nr:Uncharacterized protein TCM_014369 [Theobroma cacao]
MGVTTQAGHLNYAEDAERDKQSSDEGRSNEDGKEEEIIPAIEGDGEGSSICLEVELASGSIRRRHYQVEETLNRGMVSVESKQGPLCAFPMFQILMVLVSCLNL